MREQVALQEYATTEAVLLSDDEREALAAAGVSVTLVRGTQTVYDLRPGSMVGAVRVGRRQFNIAPKIGIPRLLYLLEWSLRDDVWADELAAYGTEAELVTLMAAAYGRQLERALGRGVVRGYRRREERGVAVRGRIDLAAQVRREQARLLPIHIEYDDYTVDTDANRLLLAALERLRTVRNMDGATRRRLVQARDRLDGVQLVRVDPRDVPQVRTTRMDRHYRPALALARLILQSLSIEAVSTRDVTANALLFDMNVVFEDFVVNKLREHLKLSSRAFPRNDARLRLDHAGRIRLRPDLNWYENGRPIFVGDVKYKHVDVRGLKHADLYQVHAYARAAGLPSTLLVYAKGERDPVTHDVVLDGPEIEVCAVDLDRDIGGIDAELRNIAERVRSHARRGREAAAAQSSSQSSTTVGQR